MAATPTTMADPLLNRLVNVAPDDPYWPPVLLKTWAFVREFMARYDPSHDFAHIRRVATLALALHTRETSLDGSDGNGDGSGSGNGSGNGSGSNISTTSTRPRLCPRTVVLAALLHDVGDRKYLDPSQDASTMARDALLAAGCDGGLAARVQAVCSAVSYSGEVRDPERVRALIAGALPELAVVQDADRLDAVGAVGIGRTFAYAGARSNGGGDGAEGLADVLAHFREKLERLEGMMKTAAGREMARERTRRLVQFRGWWEEETAGM